MNATCTLFTLCCMCFCCIAFPAPTEIGTIMNFRICKRKKGSMLNMCKPTKSQTKVHEEGE